MDPSAEKVLVTGSSGLIGSAVVDRFARDFEVIGFDREGPPHPPESADPVNVDIASDESVRAGLDILRRRHGDRLASVIHLAAYYDFAGEPSPLYDEVTVRGTERLLRGLRQGFQVEQFIFSSTMLVHGPCEPGQKIDEDWPLEPRWAYPESKVKTEALLRGLHGDIPLAILRIAGVYDDLCHSIPIANQIQRIHERRLTARVFPGDPSRGQAFVHLEDLVDAFELAVRMRAGLASEEVFLIGEDETPTYDELQRQIAWLIHGEDWETRSIPRALAKTGAWLQDNMPLAEEPFIKPWMIDLADDHYELDTGKARSILGWEPKRSLRETLPEMISALLADPAGWYRENELKPSAEIEEAAGAAGKESDAG